MEMHRAVRLPERARTDASFFSALRMRLFGISADEVTFARRGFPADMPGVPERLERAGGAFVIGYNAALRDRDDLPRLSDALAAVHHDLHGFAHEGASMGLALVDQLTLGRSRWREFLLQAAPRHLYLVLVGAGWAMARIHARRIPRFAREVDPVAMPLLWDGYGFHQGFFHPGDSVRRSARPPLRGYALRAFDQGLGRSLWFVEGASPARIAATITSFDAQRRGDLWSGAGLACAYAGGVDEAEIAALARAANGHRSDFAQGVIFAAAARERAGNSDAATALACHAVLGIDPPRAAAIADEELERSRADDQTTPRYESWRQGIAARFTAPREE
jgi:hypothetical protein